MSGRAKLGFGLALLLAFALLLIGLREDPKRRAAPAARAAKPIPAAPGTRANERPHEHAASEAPASAAEPVEPEVELRDHTGELLSDGPAKPVTLPERPEGAEQNTPEPAETAAALSDVIARLDAEIAAAHASGDSAEAERLTVRRDRLQRKLDESR